MRENVVYRRRAQPHQFKHRFRRQPSLRMTFLGICTPHMPQPSYHLSIAPLVSLRLCSFDHLPPHGRTEGQKTERAAEREGPAFLFWLFFFSPPFPVLKRMQHKAAGRAKAESQLSLSFLKKKREQSRSPELSNSPKLSATVLYRLHIS